jgi:hypothetical protein
MGSFDMEDLVYFAVFGIAVALVMLGGIGGFALATIINLGKLCL